MENNLRRLLVEKRDALKQIADFTLSQSRATGTVPATELIAVNLAVLEAELDLATTRPERVALLEKMCKEARKYDEIAQGNRQSGIASGIDALQAHLKFLDYQIRLEKEKTGKG